MSASSYPILDDWEVMDDGSVVGTVSNHPSITDGDMIATSPIRNPNRARPDAIVTTMSGSRYQLGVPSPPKIHGGKWAPHPFLSSLGQSMSVNPEVALRNAQRAAQVQLRKLFQARSPVPQPKQQTADEKETILREAKQVAKAIYERALSIARRAAVSKYNLNGLAIGEYLLSGTPLTSTSGKSQIWTAFRADADGLPTGETLVVKVSAVVEALEREMDNYRVVTSGFQKGQFVECMEFFPQAADASDRTSDSYKQFQGQCALVMEKGQMDLKSYLATEVGRGLRGDALRDCAMAAAKCLQALHTSGMVWTDLKTENFVVMDVDGGDGGIVVKGIDLESAMPAKDNPVDYSPEACPPEFATAFLNGDGPFFELDYSYDVWSYGMMLHEISTGDGVFDGQSPVQVTKNLSSPDYEINVDKIPDKRLRNLVKACLRRDPAKRPTVTQIMLHSYFLSSYNPFKF